VGGGRREGIGSNGLPYAPLKESTALRTYDFFPPLPASQWTSDRPYLVVLDVCVSGEGQVSDVALVRPASPSFDPVLLEAVRTWRYKPRLVGGSARAFCHVVAIKYEPL
jgi:TonB family protein